MSIDSFELVSNAAYEEYASTTPTESCVWIVVTSRLTLSSTAWRGRGETYPAIPVSIKVGMVMAYRARVGSRPTPSPESPTTRPLPSRPRITPRVSTTTEAAARTVS